MSLLLFHAVCSCCMSVLHPMLSVHATYLWFMSTLHFNAVHMSMLHVQTACLCQRSMSMPVLFCLSCLPVLFCLSCSTCPVLHVLFRLSCLASPVCLSCSAYPVLPVLFCLSHSQCPVLSVLSVLFFLSYSAYPVMSFVNIYNA
jgi:hypothetical protein